jgi:hypothetical protein
MSQLQNATDRRDRPERNLQTKGSTVFKVFAYLYKRPDITTDAFIDYYENHHVPLVLSLAPMPRVYKRNYVVRGDGANLESPTLDFDVVTEQVWDDRSGFENWIKTLGVEAIGNDEANFLDRPKTRAYVIDEHASAGGYVIDEHISPA